MKAKIKNNVRKRVKKVVKKTTHSIKYVHAKRPILRHFRLIDNKHSFRLVHFRHTSHITLFITLLLLGFLLLAGTQVVQSFTSSGIVNVGARVGGPPPSIGATITEPKNATQVSAREITVSGICQLNTFVVVSNNNSTTGSTQCTSAGVFSLNIQLFEGTNVLSALNYDNLNQVGPTTSAVLVNFVLPVGQEAVEESVVPSIPINPSLVPDLDADESECDNYKASSLLPTGGQPHISIVCVPRLFLPKIQQTLGLIVWGGNPPYAINIDWGDDSIEPTLLSVSEPGYKTVKFNYKNAGSYSIFLRMTDKVHQTAIVETATVVNGTPESNLISPITNITADIVNTAWFKASVPLYLLAVAITIGFWCGDIFERLLNGKIKSSRRTY